eukprot:912266-Pyramimonas_sp.AAC.2
MPSMDSRWSLLGEGWAPGMVQPKMTGKGSPPALSGYNHNMLTTFTRNNPPRVRTRTATCTRAIDHRWRCTPRAP